MLSVLNAFLFVLYLSKCLIRTKSINDFSPDFPRLGSLSEIWFHSVHVHVEPKHIFMVSSSLAYYSRVDLQALSFHLLVFFITGMHHGCAHTCDSRKSGVLQPQWLYVCVAYAMYYMMHHGKTDHPSSGPIFIPFWELVHSQICVCSGILSVWELKPHTVMQ